MLTHLSLPVDKLAELIAVTSWYDAMPAQLNETVGDNFHENFVDHTTDIAMTVENRALLAQHGVYMCYLFLSNGEMFVSVESETGEPYSAEQIAACEVSEGGAELYVPIRAM